MEGLRNPKNKKMIGTITTLYYGEFFLTLYAHAVLKKSIRICLKFSNNQLLPLCPGVTFIS